MTTAKTYWQTYDIPIKEIQECISENVVAGIADAFADSIHFLSVKNGEVIFQTLGPEMPEENGITDVFKIESKLSDIIKNIEDYPAERQIFIDAFEKAIEKLKSM